MAAHRRVPVRERLPAAERAEPVAERRVERNRAPRVLVCFLRTAHGAPLGAGEPEARGDGIGHRGVHPGPQHLAPAPRLGAERKEIEVPLALDGSPKQRHGDAIVAVGVGCPAQRAAQVVEVGHEPREQVGRRRAAHHVAVRTLEERERHFGVPAQGVRRRAARRETLERERARGLEQPVARHVSRAAFDHHERLVDQRAEVLEHGPRIHLRSGRERLHRVQREAAREHAERGEHRLLGLGVSRPWLHSSAARSV